MSLAFPSASAITLTVACGGKTGSSGRHRVTVFPDWSVNTGHDLELERIAAAFGSKIGCVDLADHRLPCARQVWLNRQRLVPVGIRRSKDGRWEVASPAHGCSCASRDGAWRRPEEAAAHLRTLQHWARAFGADVAACERLIVSMERATGSAFDGVRHTWPRSPSVFHYTDLEWLWEVGLHPDEVDRIHAGLGLVEPMSAIGYLYVSASGAPLDELAAYSTDGVEAVCWAASSWLEHQGVRASERREWFLAGLHWRLISALINSPYALADVRQLAVATGKSLNQAAEVLVGWLVASCQPNVGQVIECCLLNPHGRQTPSPGALEAVVADPGSTKLTRTEVGLILVAAGTPTTARAMIRRGVRTLGDASHELGRTG